MAKQETSQSPSGGKGAHTLGQTLVSFECAELDCSHIQIHKLVGREGISELFQFDVQLVCTKPGTVSAAMLEDTSGVSLSFAVDGVPQRRVCGRVSRIRRIFDSSEEYDVYDVRIVPHHWALTLCRFQEIYLYMSVVEIIEAKLKASGMGTKDVDYEMRLDRNKYPMREFVLQHNETDWNFICRLCEHVGISFFFEHGRLDTKAPGGPTWEHDVVDGIEKLVFVDDSHSFPTINGSDKVHYLQTGLERDIFWLGITEQYVPQHFWVRDYNYEIPHHSVDAHEVIANPAWTMGGHVEFGANTLTQQESASIAKVRSEEAMTTRQCIEAKSDICRLASGKRFSIDNFEQLADELLITEVVHRTTQTVLTGGRADEDLYRNEIKAIRNTHTYRPPRRALRPRISGVVTGTVVGIGSSSTIGTPSQPDVPVGAIDESGRYLVQLHLDTPGRDITHQGDVDLTSGQHALASLPIRMLQPSSGANYGMHFPLREGVEVMVAFVNGDPDRPVIVGSVSNQATPNAVTTANANTSTIRTQTGIVMEFSDG